MLRLSQSRGFVKKKKADSLILLPDAMIGICVFMIGICVFNKLSRDSVAGGLANFPEVPSSTVLRSLMSALS